MSPTRLLIVDDDPSINDLVARIARGLGFATASINESSEFQSTYSSFAPAAVLLDLHMPGVDGIDLLRFLSAQRCDAAIFLMSGAEAAVLETAAGLCRQLDLQLAGVLRKPLAIQELRSKLGNFSCHPRHRAPASRFAGLPSHTMAMLRRSTVR